MFKVAWFDEESRVKWTLIRLDTLILGTLPEWVNGGAITVNSTSKTEQLPVKLSKD